MTTGIYCLTFEHTDYVYIGQSINIEERFQEHLTELRTGTANYKMLAAYVLFNKPNLTILEECAENELNNKELQYISEFNCLEKGLNCFNGTTPRTNIRKGYLPVKSKYSEEVYYNILKACLEYPNCQPKYIADITQTDSITVSGIRNLRSHKWMEYKYPEEYAKLIELYNLPRKEVIPIQKPEKETVYYPEIVSPDGRLFKLAKGTAKSFAKEHSIPYTGLNKLLNGKVEHCAEWRLA